MQITLLRPVQTCWTQDLRLKRKMSERMKNVLLSPGSFTKLFLWSEIIYWWEMRCQLQGNSTLVPIICPVNCSQISKHLISGTLHNPEDVVQETLCPRYRWGCEFERPQPQSEVCSLLHPLLHKKTTPLPVWRDKGVRSGFFEPDRTSSAGRRGSKTQPKGIKKAKGNTRARPRACHLGFSSEMLIRA